MKFISIIALLLASFGAILSIFSFGTSMKFFKGDFKSFNLAQKSGIVLTISGGVLFFLIRIINYVIA